MILRARQKNYAAFISLEALMAFGILTMVMVAVYQSFTGTYSSIIKLTKKDMVLAETSALLEGVGVITPLNPGESEGEFPSGALWEMQVNRLNPQISSDNGEKIQRFWIRVSTHDRRGRELLTLETIMLDSAGQ